MTGGGKQQTRKGRKQQDATNIKRPPRPPARIAQGRKPLVIGPEQLEIINQMYTHGETMRTIADHLGVDVATVFRHIDQDLRPVWRERLEAHVADEYAKLAEAEAIAWREYRAGNMAAWKVISDIIKLRASLAGLWAPRKAEIRHQDETIRIVGLDREQIRQRLLAELGPADEAIDVPSRPALPRPHEMEGLDMMESEE